MKINNLSNFFAILAFTLLLAVAHADDVDNSILDGDLDTWEAPEEIRKNFVYYLSGFDDEDRPIWIGEVGKWDPRKYVEEGGPMLQALEKYIDQALYRYNKSIEIRNRPDNPVSDGVVLLDMEGYDNTQITHGRTLALLLRKAHDVEAVAQRMNKGFFVNVNFIGVTLINLLKPIMGRSLQRTEVYGTNRAMWVPRVLRKLPKESLPEWYGGMKDFKPVAVYG